MSQPLRIAMLAPFALHGPKGTTRWRAIPLARALVAAGHQVLVVAPPYDQPSRSGQRWRDCGVEVVNVASPAAGQLAGAPTLSMQLARIAAAWQPDVVHCFKPKGYSGLAGWWLARRGHSVIQDIDDWETGWNQAGGYPPAWQAFFRWQERAGVRGASGVTTASRWLENWARSVRADNGLVVYLPNGVPGSEAVAKPPNSCSHDAMPDQPPAGTVEIQQRVLLYARFVETSPEQVLAVWRRVRAACLAAQLVIVGRGLRGEEGRLAALLERWNLRGSALFTGWLDPAIMPGVLAGVQCALFPVLDTPRTAPKSPVRLLETLAAGVPVATQDVGEYGIYVRDGATGLVAPAGDDETLAAAVVRLLRDRPLAAALSDGAAQETPLRYNWRLLAQTAAQTYHAALAN